MRHPKTDSHLYALASEMKIYKKIPRIKFWKRSDFLKAYKQRVDLFNMFAAMHLMRKINVQAIE
jgi:hypothetical protein